MRSGPYIVFAALLLAPPAAADGPPTRFRFAEPPETAHDVYLWPGGIHLGYANVRDSTTSRSAFAAGLDVATFSYGALLIDSVSVRLALRSAGGDFFVGTRPATAAYFGKKRVHQLSLGAGLGWGSVGSGFGGREGHGQLIVAPSVRYAALGLFGVELLGLLPVYGELGETYPSAVMINVVGAGTILFALAR